MAQLQEGIYHLDRPAPFFCLLCLSTGGAAADAVARGLQQLWQMYADLKVGNVSDLPGYPVPSGNLKVLLGYGPRMFGAPGVQRNVTDALSAYGGFAQLAAGQPIYPGAGVCYAADLQTNLADTELAIQLTGDTQLAVFRAVVETSRVLGALASSSEAGVSPLRLNAVFTGFGRDDSRSWIGFHDGLSNLASTERLGVIGISEAPADEQWALGGTYLAFLRLTLDMDIWRGLTRAQQELCIGRDMLTGCPIVALNDDGSRGLLAGCPVNKIAPRGEPPLMANPVLNLSHIQRANHHRPADDPTSNRIFRQSYEFLEPLSAAPFFRIGLNSVAFQSTPRRLVGLLTGDGWLGGTSFGGDDGPGGLPAMQAMKRFVAVQAAATCLVSSLEAGEAFPGQHILVA